MNAPSLTKPAAKPVVVGGVADLQSSPLGRKAASTNTAAAAAGKTATSNVAAVTAVLGSGLSERSPDIIPRHKLLMEKSEHGANIDSPVTALTKKLEKLRIDTTIDKKQQQQPQVLQTKETKQSVSQLNKQQQQQAHSVYDNEFVGNNSELSNDKNQQTNDAGEGEGGASNNEFVGGAGEVANDVALEGNDNNKAAKQNNDRAHTYAKAITSGSSGGDCGELGVVEPHTVHAGIVAISSDLSDDEDGLLSDKGVATTKRITRTALDNIARAGTTQQFKFASGQANVYGNKTKQQQQQQQLNLNTDIPTSVLNVAPGKQIGVIRPLLTTTAAQQAGTIANSNISNQQQLLQQHMEALKQHNVYNNATIGGASATTTTTHSSIYHSNNSVQSTLPPPPQLTSREIEKNRINEMKKTCALTDGGGGVTSAANVTSNANAAAATAHASLNTVINTNAPATTSSSSSPGGHKSNNSTNAASPMVMSSSGSTSASGFSELDAAAQTTANSPLWALRIKRQTPPSVPQENTTMVFNFSNRKEVPDYIENDGVIFRRKRELPKPNESGFVLLGDLSLETSTDSDYDDFSMCPPSPCDVEFENANIVIDGKSSIRFKSKEATFHVQFNDTLTSTFEYPSEASLIIDESYSNESLINDYENDSTDSSPARHHHVAVDEIIQLPTPTNTSSPAVATNADAAVVNNVSSISATNTPTKQILGNLPLDYPILDKGIMSQQQQQQLQQQQLEQKLTEQPQQKREDEPNVASAVMPPSCEPKSLVLEKTPLWRPQHEIACNASPPPTPLSLRAGNSDKLDTATLNCEPMPHLSPQPQPQPQRPTDLPLPTMALRCEVPTATKQKSTQQQPQQNAQVTRRQQKPQLPQKRIDRMGRQSAHLKPTEASKASPANALPQFKMPKVEMKQQKQQQQAKELMEAITKEEKEVIEDEEQEQSITTTKGETNSKMQGNENLQQKQIINDAVEARGTESATERDMQVVEILKKSAENRKSEAKAHHQTTESLLAFGMRDAPQLNALRDYQLASVNTNNKNNNTKNINKNTTTRSCNTTNNNTTKTTTFALNNKKTLSKYTMFHTLYEASTAEATTTTRCAAIAQQRARKLPSVLNKPKYARFLQIDLAANEDASPPGERQAISRTRSNEFQCRGGNAIIQRFNTASQQLHLQAHASPNQQQEQPQKRSASFSFGNNVVGRVEGKQSSRQTCARFVNKESKNNENNTNYDNVNIIEKNNNRKHRLNVVGTFSSTEGDECFEDALDFFCVLPTTQASDTSTCTTILPANLKNIEESKIVNESQSKNQTANNNHNNTETNSNTSSKQNNNNKINKERPNISISINPVRDLCTIGTNSNSNNNSNTNTTANYTPTTITNLLMSTTTNALSKATLVSNYNNNKNNQNISRNNNFTNFSFSICLPTLSSFCSSSSSSTTFSSYSSLSAANCTIGHTANYNKNNSNTFKYLHPMPYAPPRRNSYNNNNNSNNSSTSSLSPSPPTPSSLLTPFSLPVASSTLLRSRIHGNTLYYV